jgi:biopolymer transport protein ExbB/TolQ
MQFTLPELWAHMGLFARLIVGAMALMSTASLLIAFERFITLRRSRNQSLEFARQLGPMIRTHGLDAAAEAPLGEQTGHLGRVLEAGLAAYRSTRHAPDVAIESVARALERQSQREVHTLKRGQGVLATVSSTAPFVGLLGTVVGIVNSFQLMASAGSAGLATVSAGIAEALVTTAFGLLVAIPAVMLYNYFQGWIELLSIDIAESSNELLDHVSRRLMHRTY